MIQCLEVVGTLMILYAWVIMTMPKEIPAVVRVNDWNRE